MRKGRIVLVSGIIAAIVIAGVGVANYVKGDSKTSKKTEISMEDDTEICRDILIDNVYVEGKELFFVGTLVDSRISVDKVSSTEENGVVKITVDTIEKIDDSESVDIEYKEKYNNDIKTVYVGEEIVFDSGREISNRISYVYTNKLDSVNDEALTDLVNRLVPEMESALSVDDVNKTLNIEMLNLNRDNVVPETVELEIMINSAMLLASVKDLQAVTWDCTFEKEVGTVTYTVEDINKLLKQVDKQYSVYGKNIKDIANSVTAIDDVELAFIEMSH